MRNIFFVAVMILITGIAKAQIIAWHFKEASGIETTYDPTINSIGLQTMALVRGNGIHFSSFGRAFSSDNFTINGTKADALANNDFISFTTIVEPGFSVSLHTLDSKLRRSTDGPTTYRWYFSVNEIDFLPLGNSDISLAASSDGIEQPRLILYNTPELQSAPYLSKITFRLYAWGATSATGSLAVGRYAENVSANSLAIGGIVVNPISQAIDISSFTGIKNDSKITLNWTTVSEQNCRGFEIMQSTDGILFTVIDFVPTLARNGFSTDMLNYKYEITQPLGNYDYYYRLCYWDKDNHNKLSKVIRVNGNDPEKFMIAGIFPNPATHQVNVLIDEPRNDRIRIALLDVNGKIILQRTADVKKGSNIFSIDVSAINKGIYYFNVISDANNENKNIKFIKE